MIIKNSTKGTIVSQNTAPCPHLWQKARGLMFSKQKDLLFIEKKERLIPLHMFFVFYPIDIIYLNSKKEVVEIKENLKPWRFYHPKQKAQYVLELKQGTIKESRVQRQDCLDW